MQVCGFIVSHERVTLFMKYKLSCNRISYLFTLAVLLLLLAVSADASLTGDASLGYTNYDVRDNSGRHISANSFQQSYSLLYDTRGNIYNSRIGKYQVALGYNWSGLDTSVKGSDSSGAARLQGTENFRYYKGHVLFSGEIELDPKEIPFKFTAYSRDLNRNNIFSYETPIIANFFSQNGGHLLGIPDISSGITNGIHIDSGATLVAGVKNGMTNGYNEFLRHFPMIMIDYRDQINRDMEATTPVDNRLSRLAFVSLNKKDNWFHFRNVIYTDNINTTNNYRENQLQIGTVDHALARRWIDFTNWLQVSTDILYTKRMHKILAEDYDDISLNLLAHARRSQWEARTYSNFERYREQNGKLTLHTTVPVFVNGVINPDVAWSARTSYRESHDNATARLESIFAGYRVDAFKRSVFNLSQHLDIESSSTEASDMLVIAAGVETASSTRFSRKISLAASYDIKNSATSKSTATSNFLEQKVILQGSYTPTNQLRIMAKQQTEFTNGNNIQFRVQVRDAETSIPQYVAPVGAATGNPGTSSYRSLTSISAAWNPAARWSAWLSVSEDIYSVEKEKTSTNTNISASFDYSAVSLKVNNYVNYYVGNALYASDTSNFSVGSRVQYTFNRNLDSRLSFQYSRFEENGLVSNNYDAEQRLDYSYYSRAGMTRKLFEINEMLAYSNSPFLTNILYTTNNSGSISTANQFATNLTNATSAPGKSRSSLSLGFKYYPMRQLVLSGGGRYQFDNSISNYSLMWYSSVGMNFRLLQASLDYYQGKRQSDGLVEKKFTANVKKFF